MPSYKLIYFDFRGRAEAIRQLFAYAGVDFVDERLSLEEWPGIKEEMPFKQLPVLEVDGKKLSQGRAITRFVAREVGLAGSNSFAAAKAEEFCEAMFDVYMSLPSEWWKKEEEERKEFVKPAMSEKVLPLLALIESNMTGEYYGEELTYADIEFACTAENLINLNPSVLDATPKLKALYNKIRSLPNIAKHLKTRPVRPL